MKVRWILALVGWVLVGAVLAAPVLGVHRVDFVESWAGGSTPNLIADDGGRPNHDPDPSEAVDEPSVDQLTLAAADRPQPVQPFQPFEPVGAGGGLAAVWDLTEGDDFPLIGYQDKVNFDIHVPVGWSVADGVLTARFEASGQARGDASVRVDVGGRPVGTWSTGEPADVRLPVSFGEMEDPEVSIDFITTTPLTDDPACVDPNHVARWVAVDSPVLTAELKPAQLDVSRAVRGIGTVSAITGEPIHVITADEPSNEVLEVIGNMAAAVGHYGLPSEWRMRFDGTPPLDPGSQIWIEDDETDPRISLSVVDNRPVLRLAGGVDGLVTLSKALADPERIDYFHYARVAAEDVPQGSSYPLREVFRFEEDGYDDRTLRGSGPQSLIYRVHIPAGVPPDAATLALYSTHSPYLATIGSTISVRINGSPEEIVALANESGQLDALHTVAPANLRPGLNYVKITTHLASAPGAVGACGSASTNSAWFTVSNTSGLGVERPPELQKVRLGVEDARFALATPVDFNGTDVAVAGNTTDVASEIELAASVIAHLSNRAQGGSPRLVVDVDADRDRHLVVVGADGDRDLLKSVPKVSRDTSAAGRASASAQTLGMVAAQSSPFSDGKVLLAFTGPTETGARRAVEAAMTSEVNDITSNFAVVSPDLVRPVGDEAILFDDLELDRGSAEDLAFSDDAGIGDVPDGDEYEQWVLEQAQRIEASRSEEQDRRRVLALSMLVLASIVAGLWWVNRTRRMDEARSH